MNPKAFPQMLWRGEGDFFELTQRRGEREG